MLHPLLKNVFSSRLVSTLAITTHAPRCCEDCARLVADKLANGKEPKEAREGCASMPAIAIAIMGRRPPGDNWSIISRSGRAIAHDEEPPRHSNGWRISVVCAIVNQKRKEMRRRSPASELSGLETRAGNAVRAYGRRRPRTRTISPRQGIPIALSYNYGSPRKKDSLPTSLLPLWLSRRGCANHQAKTARQCAPRRPWRWRVLGRRRCPPLCTQAIKSQHPKPRMCTVCAQ